MQICLPDVYVYGVGDYTENVNYVLIDSIVWLTEVLEIYTIINNRKSFESMNTLQIASYL